MAQIKPFGALCFTPKAGNLDKLVCPPYDIVSDKAREEYLAANPHNIIRLELPREGEDPYAVAGETLQKWLDDDILACDSSPRFYIYQELFNVGGEEKSIKALLCRVKLEPFSAGVVLPHEETLSKAKEDRYNLMSATGCNFSAIYSLYFDSKRDIAKMLEENSAQQPRMSFVTEDGITHNVWQIEDSSQLASLAEKFCDLPLYIADGHHRYETALRYQQQLIADAVITNEEHPANYVMMSLVAMEDPGLVVFPTHRIVRNLDSYDGKKLREGCAKYFNLLPTPRENFEQKLAALELEEKKAIALYDNLDPVILVLKDNDIMSDILPDSSSAYKNLDVNILHLLILEQLLGIDKENMKNQKNLIYTRDAVEGFEAVDASEANCAFIINPTKVLEIADVARAGEKMPQKSTYFYPKMITGHLMNKIL